MLYSDWLIHCTLSTISVQCLSVVHKISMFPCFSELLKSHSVKKLDNQSPDWCQLFLRILTESRHAQSARAKL